MWSMPSAVMPVVTGCGTMLVESYVPPMPTSRTVASTCAQRERGRSARRAGSAARGKGAHLLLQKDVHSHDGEVAEVGRLGRHVVGCLRTRVRSRSALVEEEGQGRKGRRGRTAASVSSLSHTSQK